MTRTVKINRLWGKIASVRDYIVNDCIVQGDDLVIKLGDEEMRMTAEELIKNKFQLNTKSFKSKFGEDYKLIDFTWSPNENKTKTSKQEV